MMHHIYLFSNYLIFNMAPSMLTETMSRQGSSFNKPEKRPRFNLKQTNKQIGELKNKGRNTCTIKNKCPCSGHCRGFQATTTILPDFIGEERNRAILRRFFCPLREESSGPGLATTTGRPSCSPVFNNSQCGLVVTVSH